MRILVLLLALALASCGVGAVDPERDTQARAVYEQLRLGDFDALRSSMTDAGRANATDEQLETVRAYAGSNAPSETRTLSWQWNVRDDLSVYEITHEYDHEQKIVQMATLMVREGEDPWRVERVHINHFSPAQAALAAFTLRGKTPLHYGVLALAVLAPLFCLFTAVVAGWRRRWVWMIVSLFGVGQLTLNWATGAAEFHVAQFALLGAGYAKGPGALDPWIILVALPIPALLFWLFRGWRPKKPKAGKVSGADRPTVATSD